MLTEADVQVLGLLRGDVDADAERLAMIATRPLADGPGLHETLEAFVSTGSATAAASALGLHPQTIRYRIRTITQLTGRDLRDPWDRFVLEVAAVNHPVKGAVRSVSR